MRGKSEQVRVASPSNTSFDRSTGVVMKKFGCYHLERFHQIVETVSRALHGSRFLIFRITGGLE